MTRYRYRFKVGERSIDFREFYRRLARLGVVPGKGDSPKIKTPDFNPLAHFKTGQALRRALAAIESGSSLRPLRDEDGKSQPPSPTRFRYQTLWGDAVVEGRGERRERDLMLQPENGSGHSRIAKDDGSDPAGQVTTREELDALCTIRAEWKGSAIYLPSFWPREYIKETGELRAEFVAEAEKGGWCFIERDGREYFVSRKFIRTESDVRESEMPWNSIERPPYEREFDRPEAPSLRRYEPFILRHADEVPPLPLLLKLLEMTCGRRAYVFPNSDSERGDLIPIRVPTYLQDHLFDGKILLYHPELRVALASGWRFVKVAGKGTIYFIPSDFGFPSEGNMMTSSPGTRFRSGYPEGRGTAAAGSASLKRDGSGNGKDSLSLAIRSAKRRLQGIRDDGKTIDKKAMEMVLLQQRTTFVEDTRAVDHRPSVRVRRDRRSRNDLGEIYNFIISSPESYKTLRDISKRSGIELQNVVRGARAVENLLRDFELDAIIDRSALEKLAKAEDSLQRSRELVTLLEELNRYDEAAVDEITEAVIKIDPEYFKPLISHIKGNARGVRTVEDLARRMREEDVGFVMDDAVVAQQILVRSGIAKIRSRSEMGEDNRAREGRIRRDYFDKLVEEAESAQRSGRPWTPIYFRERLKYIEWQVARDMHPRREQTVIPEDYFLPIIMDHVRSNPSERVSRKDLTERLALNAGESTGRWIENMSRAFDRLGFDYERDLIASMDTHSESTGRGRRLTEVLQGIEKGGITDIDEVQRRIIEIDPDYFKTIFDFLNGKLPDVKKWQDLGNLLGVTNRTASRITQSLIERISSLGIRIRPKKNARAILKAGAEAKARRGER